MRFIAGGLDFDGTYLLSSGEQKIYFIEVPVIIREGMIEKLVGKKFLVDDAFCHETDTAAVEAEVADARLDLVAIEVHAARVVPAVRR